MGLQVRNILFVPCIHRRVTFAEAVRRAALAFNPDVIAVELPATLQEWIIRGVLRLPRISVVGYADRERPGEMSYVPIDPADALIEAVRLGLRHEIPVEFIDLDVAGYQEPHQYVPDDTIVDKAGLEAFVEAVAPFLASKPGEALDHAGLAREDHMARRLRELSATHERVLCVVGLAHFERLRALLHDDIDVVKSAMDLSQSEGASGALRAVRQARHQVVLADARRESLPEVLGEIPYFTWLFEESRENLEIDGEARFDKFGALQSILQQAATSYREAYRQTINITQWKALLQYTRNLALMDGRWRPDGYELVIGARGIVDGDYGFEVHELARQYPPQDGEPPDTLPRMKIKNGRGALEGRDERYVMKPRWQGPEMETISIGFRRRPSKEMQALWKEQWDHRFHFGICSWPPEDETQERFMDFLRKRALQRLTEDRKQVQEFSTSMLDGLDIRETMRNWHTGKLYVQTTPQPQGRVGAVILIFEDQPLTASEFSWRTTLYAENQNESDISFFATPLGAQVVGPRICRTQFGGILSIYPSQRIRDIWNYELGDPIKMCSDQLLAAALIESPDRYVACIARTPPRGEIKQLATAYKKHLIYMPLSGFSPAHLKKIQNFHILDGRDVRGWARDFIFDV